MTVFDLRNVRVRSGEEHREAIEVELPPVELGGERYIAVPEKIPAELAVTRASTGWVFELRLTVRLHGPCMRCLGDAVVEETLVAPRVPGDEPGHRRADDARTSSTTGSTSPPGRATRSSSRSRPRSSAGPTAPASARSAART